MASPRDNGGGGAGDGLNSRSISRLKSSSAIAVPFSSLVLNALTRLYEKDAGELRLFKRNHVQSVLICGNIGTRYFDRMVAAGVLPKERRLWRGVSGLVDRAWLCHAGD